LPRSRALFAAPVFAPVLILGCGWACLALAQSTPDDSEQPAQLEEINVTARREFDERFMSTATRITVTRRDIEAMGANSMADVLRQLPGVQVTTTANGGLEIRMRGMGTEATRILIDGLPVNPNNRTAQLPLDELPADLLERIEIIRAPSAEFQGAAGGTLNIVMRGASPKRETFIWFTDQYVWGRHGPSMYASQTGPLGKQPDKNDPHAASWSYFISINASERNLGSNTARGNSSNTAAPSFTTTDDQVRLDNRYWTLTPRLTGRLGASDRVTFRGILSFLEGGGSVLSNSYGVSNGAAFTSSSQNPWIYARTYDQATVDWSHSFQDAKWDSSLQVEHGHEDYSSDRATASIVGGVPAFFDSTYGYGRSNSGVIGKTKLVLAPSEDGDASNKNGAWSNVTWSLGGEFENRRLDMNSISSAAGAALPVGLDASTHRTALWGQYEKPVESVKTALVLGLRAQDFSENAGANGTGVAYHNLAWQPSLNTRTALSDDLQYRFNLARISQNPRVYQLAPFTEPNASTNGPTAPDFRGNPNLRPTSTITLDTGFEKRLSAGANAQAGVNLFVRQQSNVMSNTLFFTGGRWVEQPANIGSATVWGIETDMRGSLTVLGLPRDWRDWTVSTNATLLGSRFNDGTVAGQRIPGQARYIANLNIAKPARQSGGWYGGGALQMLGAADFNTASTSGVTVTGRQRAHAQLDLYIGDVVPKVGFWRLNAYNVFDFRQERGRTVTDTLNGTVTTESFERRLTPRVFLTVGTRF